MKLKRRVRPAPSNGLVHESALGEGSEAGSAVAKRATEKAKRRRKVSIAGMKVPVDDGGVSDEEIEEESDSRYLDATTTRKVLQQAREQLDTQEAGEVDDDDAERRYELSSDEEVQDESAEEDDADFEEEDYEYLDESQMPEEEKRALAMFGMGEGQRKTIADLIQEKLEEAEAKKRAKEEEKPVDPTAKKVTEVYTGVGEIMKRYTSGKIPKAFKIIPSCDNWEELLWLTNPFDWSPGAVYVATRLFASNLNEKLVQVFYHDVLLPRAREDIAENRRLHFSIYQALKKAVFKPKAFFKGILFPLCEDKSCTLREATIIGSVVAKVSIPRLHSAAALLRLASMPYSAAASIFVRIMLDKKYALPYKVVDCLVDHFMRMEDESRALPLLWHRSLLTFAQRCKTMLTSEQKEQLKVLMRKQFHNGITPEIRRELFSVRSRGEHFDPDANTVAMQIASAS
mmetsp:Transcript_5460/g.16277  ORF Transcript_5460/g.16277 Transcript_5460/m.16277 type:complete len:457 (-) Transcript_5460:243-1613(-)